MDRLTIFVSQNFSMPVICVCKQSHRKAASLHLPKRICFGQRVFVHLSVHLFVCMQNNFKSCGKILMNSQEMLTLAQEMND